MTHPAHDADALKPVLVTGAAGFIGARCLEACRAAGWPVIAVDTPRYFTERAEHAPVDPDRIVATDRLDAWLTTAPPLAAIVHLGACTDTRETDRAYLTATNLEASQRLWQYARTHGVPFIYASSAATYGDGRLGYDDDETLIARLVPLNAYGDSKQQFDVWALAEAREGRAPAHWCGLKFFNVYGYGERHKGPMASVVLQAFDQIRAAGRLRLFRSHRDGIADGHQARDFVFVDDVVDTLLALVERPPARGIFNLGSGRGRTFLDLARATFTALGEPERIDFIDTPPDIRAHYQYFTQATMGRLAAAGYVRRTTSLEEGVRQYVTALEAGPGC
ncbi:MAG: ADP-glyceromanno-heptose 6-epimerase [Acidobacteria bacterium SCN 69-37]|nr:MAG: ADP-glyceromanno-heptose 6-epimerase [Acidobacteria bacterium SCN 69-37]